MKKFLLIAAIAAAVYYQFFTGQVTGVYAENGAPRTVFFTTDQCGKAWVETRKQLKRRKIEFEEYDASDNGPDSELYKEVGGTGYLPLIAMGRQRVIGDNPGGIISALAEEFGPAHIRSRERTALQRNLDANDEAIVVMYATSWCGYCKKARQYFEDNGVEFVEYAIESDRAAKRDFDALLGSGTPLLYQGYTRVAGFDQQQIEKVFELG